MNSVSRRNFLKTSLAASTLAGAGALPLTAEPVSKATEVVTLGRSGMKVTRLAFVTGTNNGRVQRSLGQDGFNSLVRYAYDRGIRFFECAESYPGMHEMLGIALKGLPRESYQVMTKVTTDNGQEPQAQIDHLLSISQAQYFDILLLHIQTSPNWPSETTKWQDAVLENEHKKNVRTHGVSVHGLPALRRVSDDNWTQIGMIRMNHNGAVMDAASPNTWGRGDVTEVVQHVQAAKKAGKGVISMKLVGAGQFTNRDDRKAAMKFAFRNAGVDCVTVGYKSREEVDEAIENINLAYA
jgi:aryl-alcohol dehydrogenase-like predicted oxidoreductase